MQIHPRKRVLAAVAIASYLVIACFAVDSDRGRRHGWYSGLGVVVPHDNFPADCTLCHVGSDWQSVKSSFEFDHEAETGVPLHGAHESAQCLRCHNDRGPAGTFAARGCAGCHEDVHVGQLGRDCAKCHGEVTWNPIGQVELHDRTRFPLVGVHRATSCRRCHVGAEVGRFVPTDTECVTCHRDDLARATNPNHLQINFVDRCDRCHQPTDWLQEELDP